MNKNLHIPNIKKYIINIYKKSKKTSILNETTKDFILSNCCFNDLSNIIYKDLDYYYKTDPASFSKKVIFETYGSFHALMHYRLANFITKIENMNIEKKSIISRWITEQGRLCSGVDIHPNAEIGDCLVLDHASNTVIGETCQIGNYCYILGGVILGAKGIKGNQREKRHPTIGNHVQIGSNVRILGNIKIGSNTFIAPNCIITNDIPENSILSISNQIQIISNKISYIEEEKKIMMSTRISGVHFEKNHILILGTGLNNCSFYFLDKNLKIIDYIKIRYYHLNKNILKIKPELIHLKNKIEKIFFLKIKNKNGVEFLINLKNIFFI